MLETWLALPAGVLIAAAASSVGIGGGILWMPFFLIVLRTAPETAVLTSLIIQAAGMASGSIAYWRRRRVDYRLALFLLPATIPGIAAGVYIGSRITTAHMELLLGTITLTTAFLFVSSHHRYEDEGHSRVNLKTARRHTPLISLMAVASGLLSVSIGEWLIPLMQGKWSLKMSTAVATSIAVIFGTCLIGILFHVWMGSRASLPTVLWAVPGVLVGGQIGPRLMARVNERTLKDIFIFLLTLIGIHLIYNSY